MRGSHTGFWAEEGQDLTAFLKNHSGASLVAQVKNLPACAWDTGSIPDLGRSHMPQSNKACVPKLLNLSSGAQELQLLRPHALEPALHSKRSYCNEKPEHHTSKVQKQDVKGGKGDKCVSYTLRIFPRRCQLMLLLTSPCPELSYILYLPPGMPGNTASLPDI